MNGYADELIILLGTGLRISDFCGLTTNHDFKNRLIRVDHQLLRDSKIGYYIETPKTKNGYREIPALLVCDNGHSAGVFQELPEQYVHLPVLDYSGALVVPGLVDLHVHAPQYAFRGLGMDLELLEWLNTHTFPEESRYADPEYADRAYRRFVEDVRQGPNTRACVFATIHPEATIHLMDLLEESGLCTMVGKVNMDRNSPDFLREASVAASAKSTKAWLKALKGRYRHTYPILTPRFIPSCTDQLMRELRMIQQIYGLPVQSHLSENQGEIAWVRELCPGAKNYGDATPSAGWAAPPLWSTASIRTRRRPPS